MYLALLTRYMEGDLWRERLCAALADEPPQIDEYNTLDTMTEQPPAYDAAVVAVDGPDGLTAVRTLRERSSQIPILWIADEAEYAVFAFRYRVTAFLLQDAPETALCTAIDEIRRKQNEHCLLRCQ